MKMKENSQDITLYRGTGRKTVRFARVGICLDFNDNKDASKLSVLDPNELTVDFYEDSRSLPQKLLKRDLENSRIRRFMIKIPACKGQKRSDDIPVTRFAFSALVTGWNPLPAVDGRQAIRLGLTIVAHIQFRQARRGQRYRRRVAKRSSISLAAVGFAG